MAHVPKKITEIYVFVATEADGGEGIPAWSAIIAGQRPANEGLSVHRHGTNRYGNSQEATEAGE